MECYVIFVNGKGFYDARTEAFAGDDQVPFWTSRQGAEGALRNLASARGAEFAGACVLVRSLRAAPDPAPLANAQLMVVSDGTARGTFITMNGHRLGGVSVIEWRAGTKGVEAVLHVHQVAMELRDEGGRVKLYKTGAGHATSSTVPPAGERGSVAMGARSATCRGVGCGRPTLGAAYCWDCVHAALPVMR